jgi:hypothetical protein
VHTYPLPHAFTASVASEALAEEKSAAELSAVLTQIEQVEALMSKDSCPQLVKQALSRNLLVLWDRTVTITTGIAPAPIGNAPAPP